jgi:hypothetical protein
VCSLALGRWFQKWCQNWPLAGMSSQCQASTLVTSPNLVRRAAIPQASETMNSACVAVHGVRAGMRVRDSLRFISLLGRHVRPTAHEDERLIKTDVGHSSDTGNLFAPIE